jgi:putative membrane protein
MWNNIGHIAIFFVIFLAATLTYFTLRFKKVARMLDTASEPMSS